MLLALALTLAAGVYAWLMCMPGDDGWQRSVTVVARYTRHTLVADGRPLLVTSRDTAYTPALWVNRYMALPSCGGTVAAAVAARDTLPAVIGEQATRAWLSRRMSLIDSTVASYSLQVPRLAYYLRVHGPRDEGYHEIVRYHNLLERGMERLARERELLARAALSQNVCIRRRTTYAVQGMSCRSVEVRAERGYTLLRTAADTLPEGARAVSLWPWRVTLPAHLLYMNYGEQGFRALAHPAVGRVSFAYGESDTLPARHTGYAVERRAGTLYAGQWQRGRRNGRGYYDDGAGTRVQGLYRADTLCYGRRETAEGLYRGAMNARAVPAGHGTLIAHDGTYYEGAWQEGRRTGFGFSIGNHQLLRAGEWREDSYRGERLTYHSERIYGIDISRFQHEVGKKKYAIDWDRLRITHLGTVGQRQAQGQVDYPVSFIYIKSTEGTSVRNRYYAADYAAARRRGIPVGSYHFFSTTTAAEAQARHFLRYSRFGNGDFPPVLDVEPTDAQIRRMGGTQAMWQSVRTWLDRVERQTGTCPVLYISQNFVNRYLAYAPEIARRYHVWIARYGEYKPEVHLAYWQLTPDGRVSGIKGQVDINVFNGYAREFQSFRQQACVKK